MDELIRFWVQMVKGQGHGMTKYGQNSLLGACEHDISDTLTRTFGANLSVLNICSGHCGLNQVQ